MTPYYTLKQAVRQRGGCATQWEVRRELQSYLSQFRVKSPIDWSQIMTREEWHAKHYTKKGTKRKSSKITIDGKDKWELKQEAKAEPLKRKVRTEVKQEALADWGEREDRSTRMDRRLGLDVDYIDAIAAQQREEVETNGYHGEF